MFFLSFFIFIIKKHKKPELLKATKHEHRLLHRFFFLLHLKNHKAICSYFGRKHIRRERRNTHIQIEFFKNIKNEKIVHFHSDFEKLQIKIEAKNEEITNEMKEKNHEFQ